MNKRLITFGLSALALVLVGFALRYGYERLSIWLTDQRIERYEAELQVARSREAATASRLAEIEIALRSAQSDSEAARVRSLASESALLQTRNVTFTLKQAYEQTRNTDARVTPVSLADACAKLSQLGYNCAVPDL